MRPSRMSGARSRPRTSAPPASAARTSAPASRQGIRAPGRRQRWGRRSTPGAAVGATTATGSGGGAGFAAGPLLRAEPLGQRQHRPIGRGAQFFLDQRLVDPGVLERRCPVPGSHERLHQSDGDARVERVLGAEPPPPLDSLQTVAPVSRAPGQALEHGAVVPGQLRPLLLQPALELGCVGEVKSVEEGAGILPGRLFQPVCPEGGREQGDVTGDEVGVEPEVLGAQEDLVRAHLLAEGVEGLVEPLPRPLLVGLGPDHRKQAVPGHAPVAGGREQGEQGQAPGLGRGAAEPLSVPLYEQPAERVQT